EQALEDAMAREQIMMAAGGIVLRREQPPLVAVVRLRKRDEWVLPKGKLDDGETPRDAAKREVLEETGHNVTVHEFLGTLVVDTGTRAKVVHYWRMEASGEATRPLMDDVRAVDWLPLDDAVERLSRSHEKTFLENVGPYALAGLIRRTKAKPAAEEKVATAKPAVTEKFAPAPAIRAAAARAAAASRPIAKEPVAKETVKEMAAAKPATARKRRGQAPEPMVLPTPIEEATPTVPAPVETTPAASTPVVAERISPTSPDAAPEPVEMANASEHASAAEPAADALAAASEELAADVAEPMPTAPETTDIQTILVETSAAPAQVVAAESTDVARVQAVAAQIKSMTTEASSRIPPARAQDEAPNAAVTGPDDATARSELPAADASDALATPATAEVQDASEPIADPAEPHRRTLAQKVRGWFGRAA
ncbi:MAG: NUDIX domain-containing protein, partial [Bradyrhizobium sp.]